MSPEELLDSLFAAISARDLDAIDGLYHAEMRFWTNASAGDTLDRNGSLKVLRAFLRRVTSARYEVLERRYWEGGAMQRHLLHIRPADREQEHAADEDEGPAGGEHRIDVCIVFGFAEGRISRIWEYVDGRALAPLGW